jgi:hypothetical protein
MSTGAIQLLVPSSTSSPTVPSRTRKRRAAVCLRVARGRIDCAIHPWVTMTPPVNTGIAYCSALSCFCACATSGGVVAAGSVAPAASTAPAWPCDDREISYAITLCPRTRAHPVAMTAASVKPVFTAPVRGIPDCRTRCCGVPRTRPSAPIRCAAIATALMGVHRAQALFAARKRSAGLSS